MIIITSKLEYNFYNSKNHNKQNIHKAFMSNKLSKLKE